MTPARFSFHSLAALSIAVLIGGLAPALGQTAEQVDLLSRLRWDPIGHEGSFWQELWGREPTPVSTLVIHPAVSLNDPGRATVFIENGLPVAAGSYQESVNIPFLIFGGERDDAVALGGIADEAAATAGMLTGATGETWPIFGIVIPVTDDTSGRLWLLPVGVGADLDAAVAEATSLAEQHGGDEGILKVSTAGAQETYCDSTQPGICYDVPGIGIRPYRQCCTAAALRIDRDKFTCAQQATVDELLCLALAESGPPALMCLAKALEKLRRCNAAVESAFFRDLEICNDELNQCLCTVAGQSPCTAPQSTQVGVNVKGLKPMSGEHVLATLDCEPGVHVDMLLTDAEPYKVFPAFCQAPGSLRVAMGPAITQSGTRLCTPQVTTRQATGGNETIQVDCSDPHAPTGYAVSVVGEAIGVRNEDRVVVTTRIDQDVAPITRTVQKLVGADGTFAIAEEVRNGASLSVEATYRNPNKLCTVTQLVSQIDSQVHPNGSSVLIGEIECHCMDPSAGEDCPPDPEDCIYCTVPNLMDRCEIMPELCPDQPAGGTCYYALTFGVIDGQQQFLWGWIQCIPNPGSGGETLRVADLLGAPTKAMTIPPVTEPWSEEGPMLYLTSLREGETVRGTIPIAGVAREDQDGIKDVRLWLDGQPYEPQQFSFGVFDPRTCQEVPAPDCDPYSGFLGLLDTTALADGVHRLAIAAVDDGVPIGLVTWTEVHFTVDNSDPCPRPDVTLTTPQAGETVDGVVTVGGVASEPVTGVAWVDLYVDGVRDPDSRVWSGEEPQVGFGLPWDTMGLAEGAHTVHAKAGTACGGVRKSPTVSVTVDHGPQAPDLRVEVGQTPVARGGTYTIAETVAPDEPVTRGVDLYNDGPVTLTITNPDDFFDCPYFSLSVPLNHSQIPTWAPASPVKGNFRIRLRSPVVGTHSCLVTVLSDDPDEDPYSFTVVGTVSQTPAHTATFAPVGDAFVSETSPSDNYGSLGFMRVRTAAGGVGRHGYLEFQVSGVGTVIDAKLRIRTQDAEIPSLSVWRITDTAWSESSITWENAPLTGALLTLQTPPLAPDFWHQLDVSAIVTGNGTYTIALSTGSNAGLLDLWSKESAYPPELIVVYSP